MPSNKKIVILGGGTNTYISNHFALSAPAYGTTAIKLEEKFRQHSENKMDVNLYLTKMAHPDCKDAPDTPEDIETLVDKLVADPDTRVIIFNVAMVDYKPTSLFNLESNAYDAYNPREITDKFGKYAGRLNTSKLPEVCLELSVQDKIIQKIRKERKDILLVGFKTTCGATKEEQFQKGLKLCKDASANIVFVNDVDKDRIAALNESLKGLDLFQGPTYGVGTYDPKLITPYISEPKTHCENEKEMLERAVSELQNNGLVTPEESSYWYNTRDEALDALVQMVLDRSHLHFTRSTVVDAKTVPWFVGWERNITHVQYINKGKVHDAKIPGKKHYILNPLIPETFRIVFDWVRSKSAYKKGPTGATVGHFGIKLGPNEFLTSKRKTDFNKIEEVGLVRVITDDPDNVFGYKHFFETSNNDKVIAFGAKPSVGGQSQRSLFEAFPDLNCIIHFHCPLKTTSRELFNTTPQFSFECGSHECITSNITGFKEYKVSDTHSIWAGHMDYHGPNIVFNSNINPQLVIDFINSHWDLSKKTTGLSLELI